MKNKMVVDSRVNLAEERAKEQDAIWKKGGESFPRFSHWLYDQWKEWDKSCKEQFGNVRWVKAMHDHNLIRKNNQINALFGIVAGLRKDIEALNERITEKEKEPVKANDDGEEVTTFGDNKGAD